MIIEFNLDIPFLRFKSIHLITVSKFWCARIFTYTFFIGKQIVKINSMIFLLFLLCTEQRLWYKHYYIEAITVFPADIVKLLTICLPMKNSCRLCARMKNFETVIRCIEIARGVARCTTNVLTESKIKDSRLYNNSYNLFSMIHILSITLPQKVCRTSSLASVAHLTLFDVHARKIFKL